MRIPKRYGQSRTDACPFCGKQSTTTNSQKVPVCIQHKDKELLDLKCLCGDWLDLCSGKYGPYFKCLRCGNITFSKGMEFNEEKIKLSAQTSSSSSSSSSNTKTKKPKQQQYQPPSYQKKQKSYSNHSNQKRETVITSDQVDAYFS